MAAAATCALGADAQAGLTAQPLAPRSGPTGATLFAKLPPEQTGIVTENNYADPQMWGERFQEFSLGAIGTGIAIADYDGDGRPDIFVVSKTEACRLFRNLGDWKFEDVTARAGLGRSADEAKIWKQGAAFADINNDGRVDLYLCRFNAPNLLYLNQGDGTFKEEAASRGLAITDASSMAAFCDYDRDGWLDVYVQTNMLSAAASPKGQRDYLFHNNGDGTFSNATDRLGVVPETLGHSATWFDFDRDGWPDLYVANDFAQADFLYRNSHDGSFTNVIHSAVPHMPYSAMGADVGDLNNDGLPDLLVADMAATTREKDFRGMAESRLLNKESAESTTEAPQYMRNALYLNSGVGRFLEAAHIAGLPATDWTWAVRLEDLDNDGGLDAFFCNGMVRELHNLDLLARIMRSEDPTERVKIMRASPVLRENNLAFRNTGDLRFEPVGASWGLDEKGVSFGAAFGDLDADGDLDLVYANYQQGVSVLRNDSTSGHRLIISLRGTKSNRYGVGAEVEIETAAGRQMRTLVLARGYLSTSEPMLHFGLGDAKEVKRLTVKWPSGYTQSFQIVAADQRVLIEEAASRTAAASEQQIDSHPRGKPLFSDVSAPVAANVISRERNIPETTLQPLLPLRQNRRGPWLTTGDLNSDGFDDLVIGGTPLDPLRFGFSSAESASLQWVDGATLTAAKSLNDGPVVVFDADGDHINDVLITRSGTAMPADAADYQPRLLLGTAGHGMQPATADALPSLPISVGAAAAADFDRDGRIDVFIGGRVVPRRYPLPARSALLRNRGGGKFDNVTSDVAPELVEPGLVTAALWTDVDADNWPDLIVALEWGQVKVFHNDAGKSFSDWTQRLRFAAAGTGWWSCLAVADFNQDGRPDIFAGNVGLNTPYSADAQHPAIAFYGDFRGNGSSLLVEGVYDGERIVPRQTRTQLAAALPEVLKRFPRTDAYARATLGEIVGEDKLGLAKRFTAEQFQSGVFLSAADGTYQFVALPRIVQIAPSQAAVAQDFDGDGHADLVIAQNSYSPIPYTGRFDGGLGQYLRGDGRGQFNPLPASESGLVVTGDAKSMAALDFNRDGAPDLVVSRNNGTLLVFRNERKPR